MERVQLIVKQRITSTIWTQGQLRPGDVVWVDKQAAQHLLDAGLCKWPALPVPQELAKPARPLRLPDGWPVDRFGVIEPVWAGKTVVCIAGGPSLSQNALERIRASGVITAVVNDIYLVAPWAELCYFADHRWWKWHTDGVAKSWPWAKFTADEQRAAFARFAGQKVTIENTGLMVADPAVFMLHNRGTDGLSEEPNGINTGSNSGFQLINVVALARAARILLVAYDMKFHNGRSHSHDGHPLKMPEDVYQRFARRFDSMRPHLEKLGVEVINCTAGSSIRAFPVGNLEHLLPHP